MLQLDCAISASQINLTVPSFVPIPSTAVSKSSVTGPAARTQPVRAAADLGRRSRSEILSSVSVFEVQNDDRRKAVTDAADDAEEVDALFWIGGTIGSSGEMGEGDDMRKVRSLVGVDRIVMYRSRI